jgi:hypothetical protein
MQFSHHNDNFLMALAFFTNVLYLNVQARGASQMSYRVVNSSHAHNDAQIEMFIYRGACLQKNRQTQVMIILTYANR